MADAQLEEQLAAARTALERGDYGRVVRLLEPLAREHPSATQAGAEIQLLLATAWMGQERPFQVRDWPAERGDANSTSSANGKWRSANRVSNSWPTAPVAPSTATLRGRLGRELAVGRDKGGSGEKKRLGRKA